MNKTPSISIIIPVLNEESQIVPCLSVLQSWREKGHEIIVVDGKSCDNSYLSALPLADRVVRSDAGRARQMNAGASLAKGKVLLFLHIDTKLPAQADHLILTALQNDRVKVWGRFDLHLSGHLFALRIIEKMINLRSRLSGIATGDQAIFIQRRAYEAVQGFPDIALMEDIAMSKKLLSVYGRPVCLRECLTTSSRRWERFGVWRTVLLMWGLRFAYACGISPETLKKYY